MLAIIESHCSNSYKLVKYYPTILLGKTILQSDCQG